ncbi:MAG: glycosyltransferase [Acidimicrobiia bacterium]
MSASALEATTPAHAAEGPEPAAGRAGGPGAAPVRVLHLLPDLAIGGGQTIVLNHLRHADRDRFEVVVAVLEGGGALTDDFAEATGRAPIEVPFDARRPWASVVPLVRLLRRERIDLLHVHSDVDRKLGHAAALATRVPVVGHLHAEWIHLGPKVPDGASGPRAAAARVLGWGRDRLERAAVKGYVAESGRVRDLFRPLVGQPITVLDQAIPLERFDGVRAERARVRAELDLPADAPVLVCVSRLVPGKGQGRLIEALAPVRAEVPGAVLVLVGGGPLLEQYEAQADRLGLTGAVRFLGDRHDVPALLGAADLFAFASENEGFGLALLEAMAAELPVVAMHCVAFEEFVEEGVTGVLVPQGDVAGLAAAIVEVLASADRGEGFGAAGRAAVARRFPPDAVARSFEGVYDQVLGGQR